jgi:hypothetical protein
MKRIALLMVSLMAVSTGALAQGRGAPAPPPPLESGASQADVDKALGAAPDQLKNQATVIKWNPANWTYTTLRKGTNQLVCFDKSGLPGQLPYSLECTSTGNLDRAAQNMKFEAEADRTKRQAAIDDAEKNGSRAKPQFGSVWYHVMGQDAATARHHMTIAVPMATAQSMGLPDKPRQDGIWIMNAGTTTAHIMTPGE